ncbi:MAG: CYTH domain-containing protein [Bacteroides sp.]|nr:CYTH domain-containing protein [Bacteroides sp.]
MAKEIERKFLLSDKSILETSTDRYQIIQGYLSSNPDSTVRIRIIDHQAFLTVKSRNVGAMRNEWEYEIPVEDAESMIEACGIDGLISKTRHRFGRWEIDEFHGRLEGLVVAEIELESETEVVDIPPFIGREVTDDKRYYNSALAAASPEDVPMQ